MRNDKAYLKACQRTNETIELITVALNNPEFGKRIIEEFKKQQRRLACPQQK